MRIYEITYKDTDSKMTTKLVIARDWHSLSVYLEKKIWADTISKIEVLPSDIAG
jgi:hypothetical protein